MMVENGPTKECAMKQTTDICVKMPAYCACMLLLLLCACRGEQRVSYSYSAIERATANGKYEFFVSAQEFTDGSIIGSPIVIWPKDNRPPAFSLVFEDGQYAIKWSEAGTMEYKGSAVLLYERPGQPLRELAPSWEMRHVKSREQLQKYVEVLLREKVRE